MEYSLKENFRIFGLNSDRFLLEEVAENLNCSIGNSSVQRFSDGEIQINIEESVRGCEVYLLQSTSYPANENIMEILVMIDALKRASAKKINVIIPYYGYSRQDRKAKSRQPITAKLVANLFERAGATRVISIDLHAPQIQGFFDIPVDQLHGLPILAEYFANRELEDIVVIAPDTGGVVRARELANRLDSPIAFIDKRRPQPNVSEVMNIIGEFEGKNAIIVDDLIDTGGTISLAAQSLIENGANAVYACCTHPVLSGKAIEKLESSPIKELIVTNTIEIPESKKSEKIKVLSVASLLAEAIHRIHNNQSVNSLFE